MPYWTSKEDLLAYEFETLEQADKYFNESFAEHCQKDFPSNNETFCDTMILVKYDYENDRILEEREIVLEYVHYHGDLKEHGYRG